MMRFIRVFLILILMLCCTTCKSGSTDKKSLEPSLDHKFSIGEVVPSFSLTDLKGNKVSIESLRGYKVIINFWATWCPPCVKELPDLVSLQNKLADEKVKVLAINVDTSKDIQKVKDLQSRLGINFPILLDPELTLVEAFGVSGFPETFIIDREGKFVSFKDPLSKDTLLRIISDRPWGTEEYINSIRNS